MIDVFMHSEGHRRGRLVRTPGPWAATELLQNWAKEVLRSKEQSPSAKAPRLRVVSTPRRSRKGSRSRKSSSASKASSTSKESSSDSEDSSEEAGSGSDAESVASSSSDRTEKVNSDVN